MAPTIIISNFCPLLHALNRVFRWFIQNLAYLTQHSIPQIEPGVQVVYPEFGVFDPTFNTADRGKFLVNASRYVPEVRIVAIESLETDDGQSFSFTFVRRS